MSGYFVSVKGKQVSKASLSDNVGLLQELHLQSAILVSDDQRISATVSFDKTRQTISKN